MEMWGKTRIEGMDGVVLIWSAAAKLPLSHLKFALFFLKLLLTPKG
jgi:hypothetical protein